MHVQAGLDRADKIRIQLDNLFNRNKPTGSFREAYIEITGDHRCSGLLRNCDRSRLREAAGGRLFEAVNQGTFASILADAVNRALVREYSEANERGNWRAFCEVTNVRDFRAQKRGRLGGYGNLPAVAENGAYGALTTPTDEEATYAVTKRGGTETISLEAVANDDVGLIRRIPLKLATAAHRTLFAYVTDFIKNNPTIYDTKALFHADHNNIGSAALDAASFAAARLAMRKQTEKDSATVLGLALKHMLVPPDLEETAFNLFQRTETNDPTFIQAVNPTIHVVPHWTDANNWFATADTAQVPLIEMGFFGGEEPQVFIADNPAAGSLFSNDQLVMKIRHIYNGAVLDHRGFYGAIVA
jgi:hypothetical protein